MLVERKKRFFRLAKRGGQDKELAVSRSEVAQAWKRFRHNRLALAGLSFLAILTIVAVFANQFSPYSPTFIFSGQRGVGPTWEHPFGFDQVGRDLLSRIIHGSRVALVVGLIATGLGVVLGVTIGALAGFYGGWVDSVLSRIIDTFMAFPVLALLILLAAALGPSLGTTLLVIGGTIWAPYARVIRADVLSVRQWEYILAARAVGVTDRRIIWRHLLPNVVSPVIVLASLGIGNIIILESALSFLGLGIRPPDPSWGGILADGRTFIQIYPHISIVPGLAIVLTVLAFNFTGDGLRDALDPQGKIS